MPAYPERISKIRQLLAALCLGLAVAGAAAGDRLVFDVNIVVLANKPSVLANLSQDGLRREADILNTYFVGKNGEQPLGFRLKSIYFPRELANTPCKALLLLGNYPGEYQSGRFKKFYNACPDSRVVDPAAINFYVYDGYDDAHGFAGMDSHGHNNGDRPFVLIDWQRLNHTLQSPEEHEMGHAFGLEHVCAAGAGTQTPTNIMASSDCGLGSGGLRNLGFNAGQLAIIRQHAQRISNRFNNH